ncbi:unnamed protein product [Urochloa humidicola]
MPCPCVHGRAPPAVLPSDLVLEIVARSDAETLIRTAAPSSTPPSSGAPATTGPAVPPRLLGFLQCLHSQGLSRDSSPPASFSLAHPATPAAARLSAKHLAPSHSGGAAAADLLSRYDPVTSRGGLVVLCRRRRHADVPGESGGICVYDPMTGGRAFFQDPPEMANFSSYSRHLSYVLLTASDGIGIGGSCSFLLLAADFTTLLCPGSSISVRTFSSDSDAGGVWSRVTTAETHRRAHGSSLHPTCSAVVLGGAVVHWAMCGGGYGGQQFHILTYNVGTGAAGSIKLPINRMPESYRDSPPDMDRYDANLRLASSPDGEQLAIFVRDKLRIFAWRLQNASWAQHAVIDMEAELLLSPQLMPLLPPKPRWWQDNMVQLVCSWERSGVVLIDLGGDSEEDLIALDVETKEMHKVNGRSYMPFIPFEVDLESRLSARKTFC